MALAVFMFAMVVIPTKNLGGFGAWIKDFCFGLFGFCAYVFPFVLGYIAVMLAIEKEKGNTVTIVFACIFKSKRHYHLLKELCRRRDSLLGNGVFVLKLLYEFEMFNKRVLVHAYLPCEVGIIYHCSFADKGQTCFGF